MLERFGPARMRTASMCSSSWGRAGTVGVKSNAANRWIFSSVKPGVVQTEPSFSSRPARRPASSSSSLRAHTSGGSPSSLPAGISQIIPSAQWRYWWISRTTSSLSKGTTADAPGWRTTSSSTVRPPGSRASSIRTVIERPW